jgi:hypothetical protein
MHESLGLLPIVFVRASGCQRMRPSDCPPEFAQVTRHRVVIGLIACFAGFSLTRSY